MLDSQPSLPQKTTQVHSDFKLSNLNQFNLSLYLDAWDIGTHDEKHNKPGSYFCSPSLNISRFKVYNEVRMGTSSNLSENFSLIKTYT